MKKAPTTPYDRGVVGVGVRSGALFITITIGFYLCVRFLERAIAIPDANTDATMMIARIPNEKLSPVFGLDT